MPHSRKPDNGAHTQGTLQGIALILGAGMLWGTTGTAQTFSPAALSPYWVGALRLAIATLFFVAYVLVVSGLHTTLAELRRMNMRHALFAGACMAGYNLAFFSGVKTIGVAIGTALALGSAPVWAGLLQLLFGQLPSLRWWLGTALAVGGGVLLVLGRGGDVIALTPAGIALCLGAGLAYALYTTFNKWLVQRSDPAVATFAVFTTGAVVALPAAWLAAGPLRMAPSGWAVVIFLGIVATGVAYLLFSMGLRSVSAASGVSLALVEPATAFLLAVLLVGERPLLAAYAGLALLFAGLALVIRAEAAGSRAASTVGV